MSDRLDQGIRELYAELTESAPEVPPIPTRAPSRLRFGRGSALRVVAAVAAMVLVAGTGAVVLSQLDLGGSDDAAAPPATGVPDRPAATSDPGEAADTVVGAPEVPGETAAPRPVERILLLAEVNRTCRSARESFVAQVGTGLDSEEDHRAAFVLMFNELETLRRVVEEANPDLEDLELLALSDRIAEAQGAVILGSDAPITPRYRGAVEALASLGSDLADFGALDCAGLGDDLP